MFDTMHTHRHEHAPAYPQKVKLAPTAEHMRLLDEFYDEARKRAEQLVRVPTITLGEIATYQAAHEQGTRVLFSINGHRHSVLVDDASMILDAVSKTIAYSIMLRVADEIVLRAHPTTPQSDPRHV